MKKLILLIIGLVLIQGVFGYDECKGEIESYESPCLLLLPTLNSSSCTNTYITIYNETTLLDARTMSEYNVINCYTVFNFTKKGTYTYNYSTQDSGSVIIGESEMLLAIIVGIGIICGFLFYLANSLDEEHKTLKFLFLLTGVSIMVLIPKVLINIGSSATTFYTVLLYLTIAFWIYVGGYIIYLALLKWGILVVGGKE